MIVLAGPRLLPNVQRSDQGLVMKGITPVATDWGGPAASARAARSQRGMVCWAGFPLGIHEMTLPGGRKLIEAPMSAVRVLGRLVPACGGGYLRHFPYWYTRWAMRQVGRTRPAIVYMHPYEIEADPVM